MRRLDPVVVHLFEDRFAVTSVVLVRRKAAPVTGRVERFSDHQPSRMGIGDEDAVDLARIEIASAIYRMHVARRHDGRRAPAGGRRRDEDRFERIVRADDQMASRRHVHGRRTLGKDAGPADGPCLPVDVEGAASFLQHADGFCVW